LPKPNSRRSIALAILILSAVCGFLSVATAQTTRTNTTTQVTSISITNTLLTTITSSAIAYTTTTQTLNSTVVGTETITQISLTTITSNYATTLGATVTATISVILTQVSTQSTQLLGNIWGESLALVLAVAALASFAVPKLRSGRPKGVVCSKCGNRNPPYGGDFCVKCGHSLKHD